jgi:hypothetical protein
LEYPFLADNELLLVDYLPGSSGQLLLRLWAELDASIGLDGDAIISKTSIERHPSTREIEYDIQIPKRITNWFLDRCKPANVHDYAAYFELLATLLTSLEQRWRRGESTRRFYDDDGYVLMGERRLYGMHTWDHLVPFDELNDMGLNVRCVTIAAATDRGWRYQLERCKLCYPGPHEWWLDATKRFNSKPAPNPIDLCTMLVDHDTDGIIGGLRGMIGHGFRDEKIARATEILEVYYRDIVDGLINA